MLNAVEEAKFQTINRAYASVFRPNRLSLGLVVPLEAYTSGPVPSMTRHLERVQLAEKLGFSAVWLRDVPLNVSSFGDAGQLYDPFVYLGYLAARTSTIALGVASVVLPLRNPVHVAKMGASVDDLSGGRVILGIASGDRPAEYPAMKIPFAERGALFRENYQIIRRMGEARSKFEELPAPFDAPDVLPKPIGGKLPLLVTGSSQQSPDWLAEHGDGWMTYPRSIGEQETAIADWRARTTAATGMAKPVMQPLYVDITDNPNARPEPIHLGFRTGVSFLGEFLRSLQQIGVNHLALNLRFNRADIEITMMRLADEILPEFAD